MVGAATTMCFPCNWVGNANAQKIGFESDGLKARESVTAKSLQLTQ